MSEVPTCPECGIRLAPDAPEGFCTKCLLQRGLDAWEHADLPGSESNTETLTENVENARVTHEDPGRYTGEREQARGGMGRILLARDEQLDRDVVIKELLPDIVNDSKDAQLPSPFQHSSPAITRFLREARITGRLQHPSIVPVHELGRREDGTLYYTMKQVQGLSLSDAIRQAGGLKDRLELVPHFLDLCQAVSYAHSRGVIHRDIKPGNVMVGEYGETVLLDWGLAKVRGEQDLEAGFMERSVRALEPGKSTDAVVSAFGQVLGTPMYMAPEQARGETDQVDERTDVYALGAVLYTLLTGKPPFTGERCDEILAKVVNEEPEPVLEVERKVPRELAAICEKAMAKSSVDRYGSAKDLANEIQRFLSGGLVAAYEYSPFERVRHSVRRNQRAVVTAAAAVFLLVVLAGSSHLRILMERNKAVDALTQAETNLGLAESAVDELLAEVSENDLMNLPQMEPVRRKLLESALAYCKQIAEQRPQGDEGSKRQTAEAQLRLGEIYSILGQHEQALDALEKACTGFGSLVQDQAGQPEYEANLAKSLNGLGITYGFLGRNEEARNVLQQAWNMCAVLVENHSDVPDYQFRLASVLNNLGNVARGTGQTEEALAYYEQSGDVYAALVEVYPDVPDYQGRLASVLSNLGNVAGDTGQTKEALRYYEQSQDVYEALVETHPDVPEYQDGLASALSSLGNVVASTDEALGSYEQARDIYAVLVESYPDVPKYRSALAGVFRKLGNAASDTGKTEVALAHYKQSRDMYEALVEAHPDVPGHQDGLASTLNNLGLAREYMGQNEEALAAYQQVQKIREALVETHPSVPDYQSDLALAFNNLGCIRERLGQNEDALAQYEQAREAHAELVEAHPDRPSYRSMLALAIKNVGCAQEHLGQNEEALSLYEQARDAYAALVEEYPDAPEYRNGLARVLFCMGNVFRNTDEPEAAISKYEHARDMYTTLVENHPDVPAYRSEQALVLNNLGNQFFDTGEIQQAFATYEQARTMYAALVEAYPEVPEYRHQLAGVLMNLGNRYSHANKSEEALAAFERSIELRETLVPAYPEIAEYRDELAHTYNDFAEWIRKSDPGRALKLANQAVELTERKDGNILDTLATILAESGQVEQAILTQREALAVLDDTKYPNYRGGFERRLRGYEARLEWEQNKDAQWSYLKKRLETTLGGKKIVDGQKGYWSPDGSRLLYVGPNDELRVLDLHTGESSQVSEEAVDCGWSPDGRYVGWRTESNEIWIAEPSGEGKRKVGSGRYRGWSPDGKSVYSYVPKEQRIYAFDIDEADGVESIVWDELPADFSNFSPDGGRAVLKEDERLWVVDRETSETTVSWTASGFRTYTAWSPDGERLAFSTAHGDPYSLELWVLDLKNKDAVQVIKGPFDLPSWSPDGTNLLFCYRGTDPPEIWMIDTKALDQLPRVTQPEEVDVAEKGTNELTAQ